ncbi:threonine/serine exporter family protein [Mycobacterium tuberculosis]|uniref:threonine/serine exporter family protein n=1 Tax=Mycobacterium tuberculosis TaxID=1773 RepID=UPI0004BB79A8|nr:threonine/serine exporter family protein [Mycobacterium tuberculosis]
MVATWTAAIGVGFLATLISIRRQAPALVTATAGIMPMLPGSAEWSPPGPPRSASASWPP